VSINEISVKSLIQTNITSFIASNSSFCNENFSCHFMEEEDFYWKFALGTIELICALNECHFEVNENNCYLSLNDEMTIEKAAQFITIFGIHYNLEDNVGVPIDKLSKYGVNITKERDTIDNKQRNHRLSIILNYLHRIKRNKREHFDFINKYFNTKHLHDLISALIQVNHSPFSEQCDITFKTWLYIDLFNEADGSQIVSSLLMAQSAGSRRQNSSADWFTLICGQMLTKCLLRPNSVINVIRAVLDDIDAVSTKVTLASDWHKCDVVARILASCPRQINPNDYIQLIGPQVLNLWFLNQHHNQKYSHHFYRVAGTIYSLFCSRWPNMTKQAMTNSIVSGFNFVNYCDHCDMIKSINNIHLVFVSSTEPVWSTMAQIPIDIIHILFQVYSATTTINDNKWKEVNGKCLEIIKRFIITMPSSSLNEYLTLILNNQKDVSIFNLEITKKCSFFYLN
jgi:hypothetical protein